MTSSERPNLLAHQANAAPPALKVDRHYRAQPAALDALVEVLHLLLMDELESPSPGRPQPTCFPVEPE
jgi:hypothetical protein